MPLSSLPCIQTKVDLLDHLHFEWRAFSELSTDRPVGMEVGSIPWSSIDRFAIRYCIVGDDFDRLVKLIRAMDESYRSYRNKGD